METKRNILEIQQSNAMEVLETVSGELHDAWFDADAIQSGLAHGSLTIPFRVKRRGPVSTILCISNVIGVFVVDSEQIGFYDLSHMEFQSSPPAIIVIGNIPIRITIQLRLPASITLDRLA